MEPLIHNQTVRISSEDVQGIYRVIINEISQGLVFMVRLDKPADAETRGRHANTASTKRKRKAPMPLCGEIIPFYGTVLTQMAKLGKLSVVETARENFNDSPADLTLFERRKAVMADFLNYDTLRSAVISQSSIASLVKQVEERHGASSSLIRRCWSLLCRYGFTAESLRPRLDRCGAPGVVRDCENGKRKKSGRKTDLEKLSKLVDQPTTSAQPGMSADWRSRIMSADNKIPSPKPRFKQRYQDILTLAFTNRYTAEDGKLKPAALKIGEYPNEAQVQRVLKVEIPRLKQILQKTTKGHFDRHLRSLTGRSWEGTPGPGHTWGIDSTIGDIYLRSSINRNWIIGRPIVYMLVDIWSTAIVGFYVCLRGPSWEMAKVAMFNAIARPELLGELWGFEPMATLNPRPSLPAVLLGDNGEYKSLAAKETAYEYIERLSFTPPYRPDLKGLVEVLHRITKDHQFWVEGAIDARRKEFEMRKFDPTKAIYTVRDYFEHLHNICCVYNLTSDRTKRLDADMIADGVQPSPAGLWRWGHSVGIGYARHDDEASLIERFLPTDRLSINRDGLKFGNLDYQSETIAKDNWTANARNFGSWKVPCHYYPGSVSRIWTPDTINGTGMLELSISDQANAAATNTYEEVIDAFTYGSLDKAQANHERLTTQMHFHHANKALHDEAKAKTEEAIAAADQPRPSLSAARAMEAQAETRETRHVTEPPAALALNQLGADQDEDDDDDETLHTEMLKAVLDAMRG